MINEHCRIYKVICIYKFSAILEILKSARRSEAPLAVTSHLGPSRDRTTSTFFLALASERMGLGCHMSIQYVNQSESLS
jgi:hypothetical protein